MDAVELLADLFSPRFLLFDFFLLIDKLVLSLIALAKFNAQENGGVAKLLDNDPASSVGGECFISPAFAPDVPYPS